jgi:ferric-dicitrate binding protein FerR (iron transport regulator)
MRCEKAKQLISFYLAPHGSWLSPGQRQALEAHLATCEPCRRDCQASREVIALLREHWSIGADTRTLLEKASTRGIPGRTSAARWAIRATAAAACLLVGVLAWWLMPDAGTRATGPRHPMVSSDSVSLAPGPAEERVNTPSRTYLRTGAGQVESLILAGRHQLVINAGSRVSVEPLVEDGRIGYLARLDAGEICAHVEHDGGRFVVQTVHGRATITGTVFDVKVTAAGTSLVVAEGSVRFESLEGAPGAARTVQVATGQQSIIPAASRQPSPPAACDAAALTAWAGTGPGRFRAPADALASDLRRWELPLPTAPWAEVQTDPDRIDAAAWIEHNREWFRCQFPWIFELCEVLAAEDRKPPASIPDYPALLLQSGDIWRFAYRKAGVARQVEPDPNGLLRAVVACGHDESWLQRQSSLASYATIHPRQASGAAAFEQWLQDLQAKSDWRLQEIGSQELHETLDACAYLAQTRTLALLALNQGLARITPSVKREVSALLQEELRILSWCLGLSYELGLGWPAVSSCECLDKVDSLLQGIRELGELEKQLRERRGTIDPFLSNR